ncbi:class I SAM-dependent methyltransferase [Pelagibius sp. Alg239-R121]|uniref:class I SAM-dependent methyltransferase n=1 Tax=Pelagibius sp. Alg239-R121 TaxID=2993448 RepID=UPI0024A72159|nr:SAM-dependent methyltransferase [Pelagibius sp. Alg239-R121]
MARPDNLLAEWLAAQIREDGPMTVADFMSAALTAPQGGYYMTGDPFGAAGDFITAPEISQIFGELIGLWCAQCWQAMGSPKAINLVELGPGRGTLMSDALRAAAVLPAFRGAIRVHLVEASPSLKEKQRDVLHNVDVTWHQDLTSLPEEAMIVIANEFFDALPVRQFERTLRAWHERLVTLSPLSTKNAPAFAFTTGAASKEAVAMIPQTLRDTPVGTLVEISPAVTQVAGNLAHRLSRYGGAAVIIDYGRAQHQAGWSLQALRSHERHEPLIAPGEADLTAHVDFAAISKASKEAGARVWGPVTQAAFLNAIGLRERADSLCAQGTPAQARDIENGVQRLIESTQMGDLFKVLAIGHADLPTPAGLPISSADRGGRAS